MHIWDIHAPEYSVPRTYWLHSLLEDYEFLALKIVLLYFN